MQHYKMVIRTSLIAGLLCSCAVFSPEERQVVLQDMPLQFSHEESAEAKAKQNQIDKWWKEFNSDELNGLVEKAISQNLSLKQTYAKLAQAKATAIQGGSDMFPDISASGEASSSRNHKETTGTTRTDAYSLGVAGSYELDLWGRVRSNAKASDYTYQASVEDVNSAKLSLAAEVATRWINIVAYSKRIETIRSQLETNKVQLELMELRYKKGMATSLGVFQQRQAVASTEAKLPTLEASLASYKNQLAVLLGEMPVGELSVKTTELPILANFPDTGIPADLLEKRPDIRKSFMQLQSADWGLSAAKADMLPKISLSANYTYGAAESSDVFNNWISNLASNLTAPIFQGGYKKAAVTKAKAVVDEKLNAYKETVLDAIMEVEDAIINEKKQEEYIAALNKSFTASKNTYDEALSRYRKGVEDYLSVLDALTSMQSTENELITAKQNLLVYRITLYRALGQGYVE
jgi:NodT family efflux transporter outer membrane factor (OMF) lipoprotein